MSIPEKTALITGGCSGIGKAIACELSANGYNIVILDRKISGTSEIKKVCAGNNVKVSIIKGDVRKDRSVKKAFKRSLLFGKLELLVNSAGIHFQKPLEKTSLAQIKEMIDINLMGTIKMCKEALVYFKENRSGIIVNISSGDGLRGQKLSTAYCASKFGVVGFSQALKEETKEYGIKVLTICPGKTDTSMIPLGKSDWMRKKFLKASDIANLIVKLVTLPKNIELNEIYIRNVNCPHGNFEEWR